MDKLIRKNVLDGFSVATIGFVCCGIYTLLIHNIQRHDLSRTLRSVAGAMCMGFIILFNDALDFFQNNIHKISKLGMLVHRLLEDSKSWRRTRWTIGWSFRPKHDGAASCTSETI
jgi:hypothetical protein